MDPVLQALTSPRRRAILHLVWDRELAASDIHAGLDDITFGAVSQHLSVLKHAGLLDHRVAGRQRFYVARKDALGSLRPWLESMWDDALYELKLRAEMDEARRGPRPAKKRTPNAGGARKTSI